MVFCIFMISITSPEHYYQACIFTFPTSTDLTNIPSKLFLCQGLGIGMAVGITYIPALGILSHYFQRRRALALGIATSVGCHPLLFMFTLITELGLCFWRSDSPHYAESFVSRISRVSLRCKNQCWINRWPSHNFLASHETAIPTKYEEGCKYAQQLSDFSLRHSLRYYGFGVSYLLSSVISLTLTGAAERHLSSLVHTTLYFFFNLMLSRTASHLSWPFTQYSGLFCQMTIYPHTTFSIDYDLEWIQCCRPCHPKFACA